jgi:hypothetical protein
MKKLKSELDRITRSMPEDRYHFEHIAELSTKPDRSLAVAGAAFLEHGLKTAILRFLRHDFPDSEQDRLFKHDNALLSSLAARIDIAYALGILGESGRHDLHVVRKIRNVFAHSVLDVTFAFPEISEALSAIRAPERPDYPPNFKSEDPRAKLLFIISYYYLRLWIATPGRDVEVDLFNLVPELTRKRVQS